MVVNPIDTGAGIWSLHRIIHPGSIVELVLPGEKTSALHRLKSENYRF